MATIVPSSGDSTPGARWKGVGVESGAGGLLLNAVVAAGRDVLRKPRAIVHAVTDRVTASLGRLAPPVEAQPGLARMSVRSTARIRRDARGNTGTGRIDATSRASHRYQGPTSRRESPGAPWVGLTKAMITRKG